MNISRRHILTIGTAGVAGAVIAGCSRGGGSGDSGDSDASGTLQFTWWGNEVRNENTTDALDAYMEENSDVSIEPQPGEWASYWDRLATQTAGGTAPDIIQMDMAFISEYGQRGALLDLSEHGADTSKFIDGSVESGEIEGALYGISAGINTPVVCVNPDAFAAAGVDLPDDMSWTWEDWLEIATEISASGQAVGTSAFLSSPALFSAWLRQQGKEAFLEGSRLGFEVDDVRGWFELHQRFADADAIASPSQITEDATKPLNESDFVVGNTAMASFWSNQLEALEAASGRELTLLRFPSIDGDATTRKAWYKASMLWSASATTEDPEGAVALINWWVNSTTAAEIELAERGVPPNGEVADAIRDQLSDGQQRVSAFIDEIQPEIAETEIAPPPGGGQLPTLLERHGMEMLFGDSSSADAAQGFHDELAAGM